MEIVLVVLVTITFAATAFSLGTPTNALWYFQLFVPKKLIEDNVFFYLYTRENLNVPQQLYVDNAAALKSSNFDLKKKTVILIHGFAVDYKGTSVQEPKNKYLKLFDYNVIAVDYGNIDSSLLAYLQVYVYSYKIGWFLGKLVNFLINQGVDENSVHIIGHSLGAHIAGFAGKFTKKKQKTLGRITGLAPSYPGYQESSPTYRLAADDANFTDCIFTDFNNLDMGIPICQANFFPNGIGISQPGCFGDDIIGGCSHSRAVELFVESIEPESSFKVQVCAGLPYTTKAKYCWPTNETCMGQYANPKVPGLFYLKTNAEYPFSLG